MQTRDLGEPVLGVVLAAGAGRRMGRPKIGVADGRWLEAAVEALRDGGCTRVAVAMGAEVVEAPAGTEILLVPGWFDGMGASVGAALRLATRRGAERLVLHLIDLPDVGSDVVARVLASGAGPAQLARATYDGLPGHPVVVGRDHLAAMARTLNGDVGGRRYLDSRADLITVECGDLATGRDIDLPTSEPR